MPDTNTVSDYMSDKPVTLHPDMDVMEAVQVLTERRIPGAPVVDDLGSLVDAARLSNETSLRGFPVMDNNCIVGQLNRSDLLKALQRMGNRRSC